MCSTANHHRYCIPSGICIEALGTPQVSLKGDVRSVQFNIQRKALIAVPLFLCALQANTRVVTARAHAADFSHVNRLFFQTA
jgi:hypothetical protein